MKGFVQDIEGLATRNGELRQGVYTAKHCQLIVMSLDAKVGRIPFSSSREADHDVPWPMATSAGVMRTVAEYQPGGTG